ncbi:DUF3048 domain-containing protein [Halobacillus sp. KGW1]|uniref:DUF3048 domain-containing protein n=1 Tax=Halobacillus sp. KGW1 TaxID=1793726 RepID=UPI0007829BB9|nr:DUF3048 domain-containing protein [Halobacillus sp. KGW1]
MRKLTFLLVLTLLAACGWFGVDREEGSVTDQTADDERVIINEGEQTVFPLTGEINPDQQNDPIVAVMINNHQNARPQAGLSKADVVYEALAEGSITRFLALFHSDIPDTIGPVRSARPYFLELADGWNALYIYHGASTAIQKQVTASGVSYLNGSIYDNNGWLFQRTSDRKAPHNSYLITDGILQAASNKGYTSFKRHEPLPFDSEQELDGKPVNRMAIRYAETQQVLFNWKERSGLFQRSSDGETTIDAADGTAIGVENVLVIRAGHKVIDTKGRRAVDLKSGGDGWLLQKGIRKEIQWRNIDGRLLPFADGKALAFLPGKTWVNIIPSSVEVRFD